MYNLATGALKKGSYFLRKICSEVTRELKSLID